jgi:hypothetical protein
VVLLGFSNPDDNAHAPNESFVLANHEGAIRTIARLLDELAQVEPDEWQDFRVSEAGPDGGAALPGPGDSMPPVRRTGGT